MISGNTSRTNPRQTIPERGGKKPAPNRAPAQEREKTFDRMNIICYNGVVPLATFILNFLTWKINILRYSLKTNTHRRSSRSHRSGLS